MDEVESLSFLSLSQSVVYIAKTLYGYTNLLAIKNGNLYARYNYSNIFLSIFVCKGCIIILLLNFTQLIVACMTALSLLFLH